MTLREKMKILKDNKLLSISELIERGLDKSSIYYFRDTGGTTQYEKIEQAINEIIQKKFEILKSLLK